VSVVTWCLPSLDGGFTWNTCYKHVNITTDQGSRVKCYHSWLVFSGCVVQIMAAISTVQLSRFSSVLPGKYQNSTPFVSIIFWDILPCGRLTFRRNISRPSLG
jgi:hypothetical protein